jgi:hypothetical protein
MSFNRVLCKAFQSVFTCKNGGKGKFRSARRKKRRGFFGKRPQEFTDNSSDGAVVNNESRDCLATVSDDPVANCAQKCESITSKKLLNTSFEQDFNSPRSKRSWNSITI